MGQDDTQERPFKVEDKRRFTASGDPRPEPSTDEGLRTEPPAHTSHDKPQQDDTVGGSPVDLSFSGFVIGLAQQAFVSLGLVREPEGTENKKDLPHAKAMIDLLAMLREKTQGNLEEVEARLMDDVLDELRLQYVREARAPRKKEGDDL